jgi:hypothetical protein
MPGVEEKSDAVIDYTQNMADIVVYMAVSKL